MDEIKELVEIRKKVEELLKQLDSVISRVNQHARSAAPAAMPAVTVLATPQPSSPVPQIKAPAPSPFAVPIPELKPPVPPPATAAPAAVPQPVPVLAPTGGVSSSETLRLETVIVGLLKSKNEPMGFEEIYTALEKNGTALPKDKPKLVIRKLLYNPKKFAPVRGMFQAV